MAIDSSANGDTVLVADGTYYERINFLGKAILVASHIIMDSDTMHTYETIIDADTSIIGYSDTGSVVCFYSGEDSTSVLQGFTIRNGTGTNGYGGGIYFDTSGASIKNCIITENSAANGGAFGCPPSPSWTKIRLYKGLVTGNTGEGFAGVGEIIIENSTFEDGQDIVSHWNSYLSCSIYSSNFNNCSIYDEYTNTQYSLYAIDSYFDGGAIRVSGCCLFELFKDSLINVDLSTHDYTMLSISQCYLYNCHIQAEVDGQVDLDSSFMHGGSIGLFPSAGNFNANSSTIIVESINGGGNSGNVELDKVIVVTYGQPVFNGSYYNIDVNCSDFYGFDSTWMESPPPSSFDTTNLYFEDPQFCGALNENAYTMMSTSICAPANNACSTLIGVYSVGCAPGPMIPTLSEWGMLIMGLLLLTVGTVAVVRRKKVSLNLNET
jgi:hypothetical protein